MSMPSSSPEDDDADEAEEEEEDVEEDRDITSWMVHCSSSSIMRTSCEMSRTWDEQHCMRELVWRCMRSSEAATRE